MGSLRRALAGLGLSLAFCGGAQAVDVKALRVPRGEEVWYVSDRTLPMIAMTASIPAGSAYDPADKSGLAAFAADLLDEGSGKMDASAFQTALDNRAIRLSITPERDYLVITLVTLSENAREAFQLLGQALAKPRFDPDAIQRVRAQILSSQAQEEGDPPTVSSKALYRAYFHDHAYAHAIDGDPASISAITQADLMGFAADHWVRGDIKIAVAGDVDAATLSTLLASAFGHLPQKNPPLPAWPAHVGQPGVQVVPMPVPQPSVSFALPGLLRNDRDFIPAFVANYIIGGGGFSSRLTDELRVKRGLTYDISTSLDSYRRAGIMTGEFATKSEGVRQAIGVVRDTLRQFAENGPTDSELADAKTYLTGSFPMAFGSNVGIAAELNGFQQVGLPVDYVRKRNDLIEAVTVDDVRRAAARIYNPRAMTIVIGGMPGGAVPGHKPASGKARAASH